MGRVRRRTGAGALRTNEIVHGPGELSASQAGNVWDDSFVKGKELTRALQEQEKQLTEVLRAMGQAKQ